MATPLLFTPLKIRSLNLKNRIVISPMCQYSATDGIANEWHRVHIGSRAVGGAGLIIMEATGVSPEARITPYCLGLWNHRQVEALKPITEFAKAHGAIPGIQLAHAGRKASTDAPWHGGGYLENAQGGWNTLAPSAIAFKEGAKVPTELTIAGMNEISDQFVTSTKLALEAGFQVIEIHMAHGYLMHEFLSPLSNHRRDEYGGSLENRMRFPLEVAKRVRSILPDNLPLFVRISATDWVTDGWDENQSVIFASELKKQGVDLIDVSSGGNVAKAKIPVGPNYQVPFAEKIKKGAHIMTGAVGLITEAEQADEILSSEKADLIFLARATLRDPYWPLHAAQRMGVEIALPPQYERSK
jgi:NADH:flavin oxidoreductases, Old Yellow Enzyme family